MTEAPEIQLTKNLELSLLDKRETGLIQLAKEFKGLRVNGVGDKEGFEVLRKARISLKNERVQLEKDGKALRESAVQFSKKVIAREKELVAIISPVEDELLAEERRIDSEKEAIRMEKERKENERIQARVNALAKFNYAVDVYELKIMPDEEFNPLLADAEQQYTVEQTRIADVKAEEERQHKEQEEKLRIEREDLARRQAEYDAQRKADLELAERSKKEREWIEEQQRKKAEELKIEQDSKEAELRAEREKFESEKRKHEEEKRIDPESNVNLKIKPNVKDFAKLKEHWEALKSDKEKLLAYAAHLSSIQTPILNNPENYKVLGCAIVKVKDIESYIKDQVSRI